MNPPSLTLHPATASDVGTILGLIRDLAYYEKLLHEVTADEAFLRATLFGPRPYAECLVARWEGEPAGFALWFHNYSTFVAKPGLYLEDIYVRPELRGRGIGTAILRHLARLAIDRGCARFEWAVLDWNAPSIAFYKRLGARPLDDWTVFRLDGDALKRLSGTATETPFANCRRGSPG